DLSNKVERKTLFERIAARATRALILSEGLLIYLTADEVAELARDLAACRSYDRWVLDLASPGLLQMMQKRMGDLVKQAGAPYKAAPGPAPLVVLLHGSGRNGTSLVERWDRLARSEGIVLVGPDSIDRSAWQIPADGPEFIHDVVEDVRSKHSIDPRRLYL